MEVYSKSKKRLRIVAIMLTLYIALSPLEFFQIKPGIGSIFRYLTFILIPVYLFFIVKRKTFVFHKSYLFLLLLIVYQFIVGIWSIEPSVHFSVLYSNLKYIILFLLVTQFCYSKEELKFLRVVTSVVGGVISLYFLSKQSMDDYRLTMGVGNTVLDPNIACTYLIIPLIFSLELFIRKNTSLLYRVFWFINLSTIFFFILNTGSRGGYLAAIGGIIIYIFIDKLNSKRNIIFIILLFILLYFLYYQLYSMLPQSIQERLILNTMDAENSSGRSSIWKDLLGLESQSLLNLIFGFGLGGVPYVMQKSFGMFTAAHNLLFQLLGELGLIGEAIFWPFFILMVKHIIQNRLFSLLSIVFSFIISSTFLDTFSLKSFWDALIISGVMIISVNKSVQKN